MKIAVLSRGPGLYSTRRLIEAGVERGAEMSLMDHLRCNIIIEQDHPQIYYHKKRVEDLDAIIPRIGASVTFYGASVITQFQMMGLYSPVSSQALLRSRNKLRSMQILSRNGIGLPNTVFTDYMQDTDQLIQVLGQPPWIIKLLEGTQGLGVVLAENQSAAQSVIEAFNKLKARIIVQEFISESAGKDLRVFIVGGKVVGAMKRQAASGFRSNLHRGGSATLVNLSEAEERTALKAAKVMGLDIAGVDILQSDRGPLVMEVNASPGLEGIEKATGVDIAGKIIEYIMEKMKEHVG
ncbi:MAG: 30S ribosomal protein S6--L-glutamate ligase [Bacteroidetes bacterium]|jgi:ribosomal protein S6--L-glutamate ligase|nr:30S ribosomal protein S6--L-glutamate ligase [Bacteroidota bacterium]